MTRSNVFVPTLQTIDDVVNLGRPWLPVQDESVVEDVEANTGGESPPARLPRRLGEQFQSEANSQFPVRFRTGQ
eukprot:883659-Pyramimonas_sp.AAC.1